MRFDTNRSARTAALALFSALMLALAVGVPAAEAQTTTVPRPSPAASVSQTIGVTEMTLHYSRPGVKERKIWGELVPYGEVWRTGANENTTITFSTPVKVEGKELPAGTYGLQTIPTTGDWTVIFSKDAELWGAFNYKPENDALRVTVKPRPAEHQERMGFSFEDLTDNSATLALRWEKIMVPVKLEVDTPAQVAAKLRWQTANQAATWCLQSGTCLDEAAKWVDSSIALDGNFFNYRTKANLLAKRSDWKGAAEWGEKALAAAKAMSEPPAAEQVSALETSVKEWKAKG